MKCWFFNRYFERKVMSALDDLKVAADKISADIDTRLAALTAELAAKDATIADLNTQLAAFQADATAIAAVTAELTTADAKLTG